MSGLSDLTPAPFGMSTGVRGTLQSGERVQIEDDNSGSGTTPVLSYAVSTPRTHGWAMLRTGHIFLWGSSDFGAGAGGNSDNSDVTHTQVWSIQTGTTSTGHVGATSGGGAGFCVFSATSHQRIFDATFMIPIASNVTDQFQIRFGWVNVSFGAVSNGAYLEANANANANAQFITSDTGVKTTVDSGIPIIAGNWYRIRIVATNNSGIDFYLVNEGSALTTPTATITTNIPNGTAKATVPNMLVEKLTGTNNRELGILYTWCGIDRYAA